MRTENLSVKTTTQHLREIQHQPLTLLISVGKENFEGEALRAQLAFMSEHAKTGTIFLADTLQRFNIAYRERCSLAEADTLALQKGDDWIARHQSLLEQTLPQGYTLIRWNTWRHHPNFEQHKLALSQKLLHDKNYTNAMQISIDIYCQRQKNISQETSDFHQSCWDYLLEECAVLSLMATEAPALPALILYPGAPQPVIAQTIENTPLRWIPLRFRRSPSLLSSLEDPTFLKKILFHLPTHVYLKDKNFQYVWCNHVHLHSLGFSHLKEILGKTDADLLWKDQAAALKAIDHAVLTTGHDHEAEETVQLADKTAVFLSRKKALKTPTGQAMGILGVSLDITERQKAEHAKTAFLDNMRHDFRTPLSGMIGLSEEIHSMTQDEEIKTYAGYLVKSSYTLLNLIDDILENIRLHTHASQSRPQAFEMPDLIASLTALFQPILKEKKLDWRVNNTTQTLISDAPRIQHILQELVGNAVKFTPTQGCITFSVWTEDNHLYLRVKDTGMGIPPEMQALIFTPFTRLTPSYKGLYAGLGLGLSNVKTLLAELQGEIELESHPPQGSCFTCRIPLIAAQVSPKPLLLMIEDDAITALVQKMDFEALGYTVIHAEDGKSAHEKIAAQCYDLILTDIGLPDTSGDAIARHLRQTDNPNQKTPVIGVTAHLDPKKREAYLAAGLDALFEKPLTPELTQMLLELARKIKKK